MDHKRFRSPPRPPPQKEKIKDPKPKKRRKEEKKDHPRGQKPPPPPQKKPHKNKESAARRNACRVPVADTPTNCNSPYIAKRIKARKTTSRLDAGVEGRETAPTSLSRGCESKVKE